MWFLLWFLDRKTKSASESWQHGYLLSTVAFRHSWNSCYWWTLKKSWGRVLPPRRAGGSPRPPPPPAALLPPRAERGGRRPFAVRGTGRAAPWASPPRREGGQRAGLPALPAAERSWAEQVVPVGSGEAVSCGGWRAPVSAADIVCVRRLPGQEEPPSPLQRGEGAGEERTRRTPLDLRLPRVRMRREML